MLNKMANQQQITDEFSSPFSKVLSNHGYGFQFSVLRKANELAGNRKSQFKFEASEFPVKVQGIDTKIDFILRKKTGEREFQINLFLLAECKKANPALSSWFFVKAPYTHRNIWSGISNLIIETLLREKEDNSIHNLVKENYTSGNNYNLGFEMRTNQPGVTSGETGQAIEKASSQILRGMNGFIETIIKEQNVWANCFQIYFLPVIFTTANLFVSDVDLSLSNLQTGEIKLSKEQIQNVPWVFYQYPMSVGLKHLLISINESKDISSLLVNDYIRSIAVVSADGIEDFFTKNSFNFIDSY